jgi:hypothetical protein
VIAEVSIICVTSVALLWLWLSVPRKELQHLQQAHKQLLERLDVVHKQASELQAVKNEIASVKVSLGWTK